MKPTTLKLALNTYPPYLGTGIWVTRVTPDYREIDVQMRLRWYNKNPMGTHFGGSLLAMTDPFYMLMLSHILGGRYQVWDKSSSIEFVKPGRGKVTAKFRVSSETIEEIVQATSRGDKFFPQFRVDIVDENNEVVASVLKELYVRRKRTLQRNVEKHHVTSTELA